MTNCTSFEINDNVFHIKDICYGIVGLMPAISNSIILVAMIKDPLKKLRTTFNYLVVNLCICDLLNGIVTIPSMLMEIRSLEKYRKYMLDSSGTIHLFLPNTILFAVFFSMCALSIDRYKAIVHPIKYRQNMCWRRCVKYTMLIWLFAIFLASLAFLIKTVVLSLIYTNTCFTLNGLVQLMVYFRVKKAIHSHNTEFEEKMKESLTASQETVKNRLKTEQKITRVYFVILMTVLITTLPGLVILDFTALYQDVDCLVGFIAFNVRLLLLYSNSVMNPLVCMFMLKNFKETIKVMFCCCI